MSTTEPVSSSEVRERLVEALLHHAGFAAERIERGIAVLKDDPVGLIDVFVTLGVYHESLEVRVRDRV